MNERFLTTVAFGCLVFLLFSNSWRERLLLSLGFISFFPGVIIGQSRGLWMGVLFALIYLFFTLERKRRSIFLLYTSGAFALIAAGAYLFFGDLFVLISAGLTERFSTIQTAHSADLSLVNRFVEWKAAMSAALMSPVVGHGFGVEYSFYDLTWKATNTKSHIHSMFIGVFYRHGIIGLSLMLYFLYTFFRIGKSTIRNDNVLPYDRRLTTTALLVLVAILTQATMESMMIVTDGPVLLAICGGVIMGVHERGTRMSRDRN